MEETTTKQLFRRFTYNLCKPDECNRVLDILKTDQGQKWYSDLMDEAQRLGDIEEENLSQEVVDQRYYVLESMLEKPKAETKIVDLRWIYIAASVTGILLVAAIAVYNILERQKIVLNTAYGIVRTTTLPDGSSVTLNGNSQLKFQKSWDDASAREVELTGEAYFHVKETPDFKPFKIIMAGTGEIRVLGTEFNVAHRADKCRIVLKSGRINLQVVKDIHRDLIMKPGELIEFSGKRFDRRKVNPALYTAWADGKLIFDHTKLREIAEMLKENYNLKVEVSSPDLWERQITGTAPIADLNNFLQVLGGFCKLDISRQKDYVMIGPHTQ